MNKEDAPQIVAHIGEGYFLYWVRDLDNNIEAGVIRSLTSLRNDAANSRLTGPNSWEVEDEAVRIILQELEQDQLDQILKFYFEIYPEEVGNSRKFFERLHETIQEGISESRRKNSDE